MAVELSRPTSIVRPQRAEPGSHVVGLQRVTADLQWHVGLALVVLVLCAIPYAVSAAFGPRDLERVGTFWFARDFSQYQAAMREAGASPSWLIHDRFTAEPHEPILMYPLYAAAGKLATAAHVDNLVAFAALEWVGRIALLAALATFMAAFLRNVKERRLALLLAVGTLGLVGWALPLRLALGGLGLSDLAALLPSSVNVYLEINSFGVFLSAPHLMLGLALTLLIAPLYLRARQGGWRWLAVLTGTVALLSLVHPFNTPVLVSICGVDALLTAAAARKEGWRSAVRRAQRPLTAATAAAVAALPVSAYNLVLFQFDPFWSGTYGVQNLMPAPAPLSLLVDFGLVLLAAPLAWRQVRAWPSDRRRLALLWVGLSLLWLYAPVPYQRRFAFGVQPMLAVLAALGLLELNQWMRARSWGGVRRRAVNYAVALGALATSVLVYLSLIASAATNAPSEAYLWSSPEATAARWLADRTTADDVALAATLYANPLVGAFDGRVVHGHIVATRESAQKEALVKRFYAPDATVAERSALLQASGATVVALGPRERALGATELAGQPELQLIYDQGGVQWHRVVAPDR